VGDPKIYVYIYIYPSLKRRILEEGNEKFHIETPVNECNAFFLACGDFPLPAQSAGPVLWGQYLRLIRWPIHPPW